MGCYFLLQGIFPRQGSNLDRRQTLYRLSRRGSPIFTVMLIISLKKKIDMFLVSNGLNTPGYFKWFMFSSSCQRQEVFYSEIFTVRNWLSSWEQIWQYYAPLSVWVSLEFLASQDLRTEPPTTHQLQFKVFLPHHWLPWQFLLGNLCWSKLRFLFVHLSNLGSSSFSRVPAFLMDIRIVNFSVCSTFY